MQSISDSTQHVGRMITDGAAFHRHAAESIMNAKNHIIANCDAAQKVIDNLKSLSLSNKDDQQKRADAIDAIVAQALEANTTVVSAAGDAIASGRIYPPAADRDIPRLS